MTTLIFVRHGQSQTNIEQRFAGQFDTPLTNEGILQAKLLSDWVADNFSVDKIYSSSLRRAVDTAMVCSKNLVFL